MGAYCGQYQLSVWFFVVGAWLNSMQSSVAGASTGPLLNEFTVTANRGTINSIKLCMNLGRMIGPLVYGQVAEYDINLVWVIAGAALLIKSFLTLFIVPPAEETKVTAKRKQSVYG